MSCPPPARPRFCGLNTCCARMKIENGNDARRPEQFGPKSLLQPVPVLCSEPDLFMSPSTPMMTPRTPREHIQHLHFASGHEMQECDTVSPVSRLNKAMKRNNTVDLRNALDNAITAGVDDSTITEAQLQLDSLKCFAWESLEKAVERRDDAKIQRALTVAMAAGLEKAETEEILEQGEGLGDTREKNQVKKRLDKAMKRNDTVDLQVALNDAANLGVDDSQLAEAKMQMESLKCFAWESLARAVEAKDPASIRRALDVATSAGLTRAETKEILETY
eukprot:gnl/MRDRNA2_/MRDRNA2_115463_c0_seq1.p1 gnl/MRDRNA2_/MRDRNA2_115463_c0~~gnl/MRDRNA2_/MRDRNA2_115463_c0_seq1.p1  ORF type:complete len:277 (-),score=60.49 gnl/MRDRNA2_/MRDRNA2_115463_c0_seq1:77-907(-)